MAIKHTFDNWYKEAHNKTVTKTITRSQAIMYKCKDCCAGYKNEIKKCAITDCPLYPFRPYQKTAKK
jgi:hypothetical protein